MYYNVYVTDRLIVTAEGDREL